MASSGAFPFRVRNEAVEVAVRVTTRASHTKIVGTAAGPQGAYLKVAVTSAPTQGKANESLLKLLAKEWGIAKSALTIKHGLTDRRKTIVIEGEATTVQANFQGWIQQYHG